MTESQPSMNETRMDVVLLSFIERLHAHDSWCGETHVQKGVFFFQELTGVPLGFDFILYKHGPYSFGLKDKLTALMADGLLASKPRLPYGPSLVLGENSGPLLDRSPISRARFLPQAEFVADRFGSMDVKKLERLATAFFVTRHELPDGDVDARAAKLHELKPHVPLDVAVDSVSDMDRLSVEAKPLIL